MTTYETAADWQEKGQAWEKATMWGGVPVVAAVPIQFAVTDDVWSLVILAVQFTLLAAQISSAILSGYCFRQAKKIRRGPLTARELWLAWRRKGMFWNPASAALGGLIVGNSFYWIVFGPTAATKPMTMVTVPLFIAVAGRCAYCFAKAKKAAKAMRAESKAVA